MTALNVALNCAARGWHVFPCKRDKSPMTKHGFLDATLDEVQIREWWTKRPQALVGIATGVSELVVVDVDTGGEVDGYDGWAALKKLDAKLEDTLMVETPSGGLHVYYQANGHKVANSASKLAPGIDVRAEGGYVIAGGSTGYEYVDGHGPVGVVQKLPAILAEKIAYRRTSNPVIPEAVLAIPEGRRDAALTSLAGSMRRQGFGQDAIAAALAKENVANCKPPLAEKDVERIAKSVSRYAPDAGACDVRADPASVPPLEDFTDTGNAHRFVRLYAGKVRWCDIERRWYVYDGICWRPDEVLMVGEWMHKALLTWYEDAARAGDDKESKAIGKWASHCMSKAARSNALELSKCDARIRVHPQDFDADGMVLNCRNGTLDLRTGDFRPHAPGDLLRKVAGADYFPEAASSLWDKVISEALGCDVNFIEGFQRAVGYSLTTSTREELFFIMQGPTQSVKSTICDALRAALGSYCATTSSDIWLTRSSTGGNRGDLVALDGVRIAITAELPKSGGMATTLLKQFVGGDPITAAEKYQLEQTMTPTAKVWIHTNYVPKIPDDDDAMWRRAVAFPFEHPPAAPDPSFKERLKYERQQKEAVLAWAVHGTEKYLADGYLKVPDAARIATTCLRVEMDPIQDWFTEYCRPKESAWTSNATLRESYQAWCKENGVRFPINGRSLGKRLAGRGLEPALRGHLRGWKGVEIVLRSDEIGV